MMKIGNVTALPSVYSDHPTRMPRTIVTTPPTQIVGTNTCLKASIGNKTDYYPTFSTVFSCTYKTTYTYWYVSMLTIALSSVSS